MITDLFEIVGKCPVCGKDNIYDKSVNKFVCFDEDLNCHYVFRPGNSYAVIYEGNAAIVIDIDVQENKFTVSYLQKKLKQFRSPSFQKSYTAPQSFQEYKNLASSLIKYIALI